MQFPPLEAILGISKIYSMEVDENFIRELAIRLRSLEENEKTKLECKREWYQLSGKNKRKRDVERFCRDLAGMANAPGPDGYIVIGLEEKTGKFFDSPFRNSGFNDLAKLQDLVIRRINKPLQFDLDQIKLKDEKLTISVIKIPRSISKPHTISNYKTFDDYDNLKNEYEHYTPIRRGSRIHTASAYDYELMFLDRQSIIVEYNLSFLPIEQKFAFNIHKGKEGQFLKLTLRFLVQNTGRNPIAISSSRLVLDSIHPRRNIMKKPLEWDGTIWVLLRPNITSSLNYSFPDRPLIIPVNDLSEIRMEFWSVDLKSPNPSDPMLSTWIKELQSMQKFSYSITLHSSNNKSFRSDTWEVKY